jgi:hypothetical protein
MYYKLIQEGKTFMLDSTADQVYTPGGTGVNTAPLQRHIDAAIATEGEILRYPSSTTLGVNVAAFFRAGLRPDSDGPDGAGPNENHFPSGAPFGVAEPAFDDAASAGGESSVTYNRGRGGFGNTDPATKIITSPSGSSSSPSNRGAMSQNGSDFLADGGWNYVDILRFYYGADIRLEVVQSTPSASLQHVKPVANFEVDEGYFANNFSSSQNRNLSALPAQTRDTTQMHTGAASQKVVVNYNESNPQTATTGFVFHSVAGLGPNSITDANGNPLSANVSAPVGVARTNIVLEAKGSIGFWLLAFPGQAPLGLTASLLLDDEELNPNAAEVEMGLTKPVIADGLWHKYEWFLDNPLDWLGFGTSGDGLVDGNTFSIDALRFTGLSDGTFFLDDVFWNPNAIAPAAVPEASSIFVLGLGGVFALSGVWLGRRMGLTFSL